VEVDAGAGSVGLGACCVVLCGVWGGVGCGFAGGPVEGVGCYAEVTGWPPRWRSRVNIVGLIDVRWRQA